MHRISVANVPAHLLGSAMHALKFVAEPGKWFPHVVDNKVNRSLEGYCNHKRSARMLSVWHGMPPSQPHWLCYLPPPPIQKAQNARHANIGLGHQVSNDTKRHLWHANNTSIFRAKLVGWPLIPSNTVTFVLLDHGSFSGSDMVWLKTNSCGLS